MDWHRATRVIGLCGACREPISPGAVYAFTTTKLLRCARCAERMEPPPPTIESDPEPPPPPAFNTRRTRRTPR